MPQFDNSWSFLQKGFNRDLAGGARARKVCYLEQSIICSFIVRRQSSFPNTYYFSVFGGLCYINIHVGTRFLYNHNSEINKIILRQLKAMWLQLWEREAGIWLSE